LQSRCFFVSGDSQYGVLPFFASIAMVFPSAALCHGLTIGFGVAATATAAVEVRTASPRRRCA